LLELCVKEQVRSQIKIKTLFTGLKIANWNVRFIRCDNAGKNMTMKNDPEIKSFGIKFEFLGSRTTQRNQKVERKFQTLYGRIRAMLNGTYLEGELRDRVWVECVMNITYSSNIILTKSNLKSLFESLHGEKPTLQDNLKIFGEVGVVTTKDKIQAKFTNQGTTCMFVGYTEHHSRDVYRMLNLTTNSMINSRDIIWLNKTYREWKNIKTTISTAEDDTIEMLTGIDKRKLITNSTKHNEEEVKDTDKKVFRAPKAVEEYNHGREMILDQVNLALFSTEIIKEPTTNEEAINSEQKEDQNKWENAINKELKEMEKRGVWEIINEKDIPIDCRCIKNKWIFKLKRHGIFRGRLVACGYSQVLGIDFSKSFAPVLNDASFKIILIVKLVWNMTCTVVDIETAFLHGDLDEEIYMEVPKGLEIENKKKLILRKTIYDLVQSARKFMRNFMEANLIRVCGQCGMKKLIT
jgi:hypothetical protein